MSNTNLHIAFHAGYVFVGDLCGQAIEQVELLQKIKNQSNDENKDNQMAIRAIKSALILISFNMLEGYANFLASLILALDSEEINELEIKKHLSIIEQDILREEESKFNFKNYTTKTRKNAFVPTLDKIKVVLNLIAKIYDKEYTLDISDNKWEMIKKLKEERDKLTHLKFDMNALPSQDEYLNGTINEIRDNINKGNPTFNIDDGVLFNGVIGIRWYFDKAALLLQSIFKEKISGQLLWYLETLLFKLIYELGKVFEFVNNTEDLERRIGKLKLYETEYYDHVEEALYNLTANPEESD